MKKLVLYFLIVFAVQCAFAQEEFDSSAMVVDTTVSIHIDTSAFILSDYWTLDGFNSFGRIEEAFKPNLPHQYNYSTVFLLITALLLIMLSLVTSVYRGYLPEVFREYFHPPLSLFVYRGQKNTLIPSLILNIIFVVSTALLILLLRSTPSNWLEDLINLLYLVSFIALFYTVRLLILSNLSKLIDQYDWARYFGRNLVFANQIFMLICLPICVLLVFHIQIQLQFMLIVAIVSAVLLQGYVYIKSIIYGGSKIRAGFFHFFIYLCALEIGPFLFTIKWFKTIL